MISIVQLRKDIKKASDPKRAKVLKGYFKTGKGEYGEGDIFLGLTIPQSRKLAIKYKNLTFTEIYKLLKSPLHEERVISLLILVHNFNIGDEKVQKKIYDFYLKNIKYINNWDLVDLSADKIVGGFLFSQLGLIYLFNDFIKPSGNTQIVYKNISKSPVVDPYKYVSKMKVKSSFRETTRPHEILINLAKSKNLWERRIAMISTFHFIKNSKFEEALEIAEILLFDNHDLIHKAVGWMLREIGKRDLAVELRFLDSYYKKIPRTTLRYAIERFPEKLRKRYLS